MDKSKILITWEDGFTLIELLISLLILILVLSIGYGILFLGVDIFNFNQNIINTNVNTQVGIEYIINNIRNSTQIELLEDIDDLNNALEEENLAFFHETWSYFFLNDQDKLVHIKWEEDSHKVYIISVLEGVLDTINFIFTEQSPLLTIELTTYTSGLNNVTNKSLKIKTKVYLQNMTTALLGEGEGLKYTLVF